MSLINVGSGNQFAEEVIIENVPSKGVSKDDPPVKLGSYNVFKKRLVIRFQNPVDHGIVPEGQEAENENQNYNSARQ